MGVEVFSSVLRPFAKAWYGRVVNSSGAVRARDHIVTGSDPAAHRVLLLGSGVTSGWGVLTHGLALTGLLADAVTERTGRGCEVEFVGDEILNAASVLAWLGGRASERWDAVVVALGINDAVRLIDPADWSKYIGALLDHLDAALLPDVNVVVAGIPAIPSIVPLAGPLTGVAARHAGTLNRLTRQLVVARRRTSYIALPEKVTLPDRPWGSVESYQPWADALAAPIADAIARTPTESVAGERAQNDVHALTSTLMSGMPQGREGRLQQITVQAQQQFGADIAQVNLLDGDRTWVVAHSDDAATRWMPRELTYCATTVREGALEVRNANRDTRFAANPLIEITGLTSYAGVAVHAPNGEPVGTLCLFGGRVRRGIDMAALRLLADQVEVELALTPIPVPTP